jgi:hypothetical protein
VGTKKEKTLMISATIKRCLVLTCCITLILLFGVSDQTWGSEPLVRTDRFGYPLPKDALVRVGAMPFRIEGYARSVAFSPDGNWLAAGD